MKSKNKPKQQHYIPRTYLNQFRIAEVEGSFTYCYDLSNKYRKNIQKIGLNHATFKRNKYYHHSSLIDPYSIETAFSEIENDYNRIIEVISSEKTIGTETVELLIEWIFVSRMRSPLIRNNIENKLLLLNAFNKNTDYQSIIEESKIEHLSIFFDPHKFSSTMWPFISGINAKNWKILAAPNGYSFLGCDNPGFLLNANPETYKKELFKQFIEVDADSLIYFVLSNKYCLEICYFEQGTPLDKCAMNMAIEFEEISVWHLDLINHGTFFTAVDVVFCDNREQLKFIEDFGKTYSSEIDE
ncbi:hypothetical protein GCM10027592_57570 [Spirosoma flavus]